MSDNTPEVPKFRYLFINEDYELEGTNDPELAAWLTTHGSVVDVVEGTYLRNDSFAGSVSDLEEVSDEWKQAREDERLDQGVPDNDDI